MKLRYISGAGIKKKKIQIHTKLKNQKDVHLSEIFNKLPDIQFNAQNKENLNINCIALSCSEVITPRVIDFDFYNIQKKYRQGLEIFTQIKSNQDRCLDNFFEGFARV